MKINQEELAELIELLKFGRGFMNTGKSTSTLMVRMVVR